MKTPFSDGKRIGVQAVRRALDLLEAVARAPGSAALADLSKQARLNKSTTYQLLVSLQASGFVSREVDTRRYRLGFKVLEIARSFSDNSDLISRCEPLLREIRDRTGETATLYFLSGDHRVTVARVESPHPIRRSISLGEAAPLTKGAGGKIILAFLSSARVKSIIARAHRNGGSGRGRTVSLLKELRRIRALGVACTFGEHVAGAFGIAVPLFDGQAEVLGSLAVSGPAERLTATLRRKSVETLRQAASRLAPPSHAPPLAATHGSRGKNRSILLRPE